MRDQRNWNAFCSLYWNKILTMRLERDIQKAKKNVKPFIQTPTTFDKEWLGSKSPAISILCKKDTNSKLGNHVLRYTCLSISTDIYAVGNMWAILQQGGSRSLSYECITLYFFAVFEESQKVSSSPIKVKLLSFDCTLLYISQSEINTFQVCTFQERFL